MTDRKQEGSMRRSRALPRRVRVVRVDRSRRSHLVETKATALRVRTSDTAAITLERMTSGRSLMVVLVVEEETAIVDGFGASYEIIETERKKERKKERG